MKYLILSCAVFLLSSAASAASIYSHECVGDYEANVENPKLHVNVLYGYSPGNGLLVVTSLNKLDNGQAPVYSVAVKVKSEAISIEVDGAVKGSFENQADETGSYMEMDLTVHDSGLGSFLLDHFKAKSIRDIKSIKLTCDGGQ